jgi:hypothetical protein
MNMGGSQEAARIAFLERKRLEEEQAAMFARKRSLGVPGAGANLLPGLGSRLDPSTTIGSAGDPRVTGKPDVTTFLEQFRANEQPNIDQVQKLLGQGKAFIGRGPQAVRNLLPTPNLDEFSESNIPFFTGTGIGGAVANRSLKTPPGAPAAPIIPVGARARHHPGFDQYAYTGKPNRDNPFSSKLLADLRKPEEDEFMSWDDKMFLLSLLEGMQGGDPPTPYGYKSGGGTKAWATPMRMS